MRRITLLLLCLWALTRATSAGAQEGEPGSLRCTGSGAQAPAWYTEPPKPPADAYQAEARSGGCEHATTAQQVAARLASWLLVYQKSPRAVLEEIELRRRVTAQAGAWSRLQREFEVVERAVARKVLTRSWVDRQETRWTEDGEVEHFLVVRADTAALREAAAEELEAYFQNPDAYLAEGRREFSDRELRWASLTDSRGVHRIVPTTGSPGAVHGSRAQISVPPPLKRVVLSWRTDPTVVADSLSLMDRPQRATAGVTLTQSESPWRLAVGGEFVRPRDRELPVSGQGGTLRISDVRELAAYGLLAVPRQLVPVYAGYRSRKHILHPLGRESELERTDRSLVLGLGVPPFTELRAGVVRNAYLQTALWPKLLSLEAGTRVQVAHLPGASVNGLLGVSLGFSKLADAEVLGVANPSRQGEVYLDKFGTEAGLELFFGDAVGVFALWEYETSELALLPERDDDEYGLLFGSTRSLGEEAARSSLSAGLRLSF